MSDDGESLPVDGTAVRGDGLASDIILTLSRATASSRRVKEVFSTLTGDSWLLLRVSCGRIRALGATTSRRISGPVRPAHRSSTSPCLGSFHTRRMLSRLSDCTDLNIFGGRGLTVGFVCTAMAVFSSFVCFRLTGGA